MKQHTINRRLFALLFSVAFVLLALPGMAFAAGNGDATEVVGTHVASVTMDSDATYTYYTDLQGAIDVADGGKVTLLKDVTTTDTIDIDGTVTLDLAGYGITYSNDAASASVITVSSDASLTLQDSAPTKNADDPVEFTDPTDTSKQITVTGGYITGGNATYGGGVYVAANSSAGGIFIMEGGTIVGNTANNGGGVYMEPRSDNPATFTMTGGTIVGNIATEGGGGVYSNTYGESVKFTMSGSATIQNNTATYGGGGVFVMNGTFEMTGGTISGNTATNGGGGVYVFGSSSSFEMSGGTITTNTATFGAGVYVEGSSASNSSTFTMSGGTITTNTASSYGGGVYLDGSSGDLATFTMQGGEISTNTAGNNGGGVYMSGSGSTFTISGGTISGNNMNYSYGDGGGVCVTSNATFTIAGTSAAAINITGNTREAMTATTANNVYLASGKTITLTGTPASGSQVGVTMFAGTGMGDFIEDSTVYTDIFTSDNSAYAVLISAGTASDTYTYAIGTAEASVTGDTGITTNYATLSDALDAVASSIDVVTLLRDIETTSTISVSTAFTLDLAGFDITYKGTDNGSVIKVSSRDLTLTDSTTKTEYTGTVRTRYGYWVGTTYTITETQPTSTTYDTITGGIITGGTGTDNLNGGGGVYVASDATFIMDGGTIAANSTDEYGGGVHVNGGTFNMRGGTIVGNSATYGGGVYVMSSSSIFIMTGTAVIRSNSAISGGGVYVTGSGIFTMDDTATIMGNSAVSGGGVYVANGAAFTMVGTAAVTGNSANSVGGGVFVSATIGNTTPTFTMAGGTISGNTVDAGGEGGGGVYVYNATFQLGMADNSLDTNTQITITGNTVGSTANNVFLNRPTSITTPYVTVQSTLVSGSQVGITVSDGGVPTPTTTGIFTTAGVQADGVFTADNSDYAVLSSIDSSGNTDTYTYTIGTAEASVTVGSGDTAITTYYATLAQAVDVANDASNTTTITLLAHVTTAALEITNENLITITLDLNGYSITCTDSETAAITVSDTANLAITGTGTIKGGTYGVSVVGLAALSLSDAPIIGTQTDGVYSGGIYLANTANLSLSGNPISSIYLESNAVITVTGLLGSAKLVVTTAQTPAASTPVTVAVGSGGSGSYTLTDTDLAAFSTTSTTASLGLAADGKIYLAVAPTLTVTPDATTSTSTAVVYTLATNASNYTYAITNESGVVVTTDVATLTLTETGVYSIVVTDTATGVSSAASVVTVYGATFDDADDFIVNATATGDDGGYSADITLPAAPSRSGYTFMGWLGGTTTYAAGASLTITADTAFIAVWNAVPSDDSTSDSSTGSSATVTTYYIIGLGTNGYGSIAPMVDGYDYVLVSQGDSATFSFIPMDGYEVYKVYVDGVANGAQSFYTITNASANHGIYVEFAPEGTLAREAAAAAAGSTSGTTAKDDTTADTTDDTADTTAGDGTADDAMQVEPEGTADDATEDDTTADDAADDAATSDGDTTQADADKAGGITLPALLGMAALAIAALGGGAWWFLAKRKGDED